MTTIIIELPDEIAADIAAKAAAWKMSVNEVMHEAAVHMVLHGEHPHEALDLTQEEIDAFYAAQLDLAEGQTVSHEKAMAHFRGSLGR